MTLLKPYEFIDQWERTGVEPFVPFATLGLDPAQDRRSLIKYATGVLVEAIVSYPKMVPPFFASNLSKTIKSLQSPISQDGKRVPLSSISDPWFLVLSETLVELPSYEIEQEEGLALFVEHIKREMNDLRASTPYGHLPHPISMLLGLAWVCHASDGITPLLGYRMMEEILPLCTIEEKDEFVLHFLKVNAQVHAFDFVVDQVGKGNLSFPHTPSVYKELLSLCLSGWSDVLPSHRQQAIALLSNKALRNDILKRLADNGYKMGAGDLSTRFPDFNNFCHYLPEEETKDLVDCLLMGLTQPSDLPPVLRACFEKDLINQEIKSTHKTLSSKKM